MSVSLGNVSSPVTSSIRATSVYTAYTGGPLYARQMPGGEGQTPGTPSTATAIPSPTGSPSPPALSITSTSPVAPQPIVPSAPSQAATPSATVSAPAAPVEASVALPTTAAPVKGRDGVRSVPDRQVRSATIATTATPSTQTQTPTSPGIVESVSAALSAVAQDLAQTGAQLAVPQASTAPAPPPSTGGKPGAKAATSNGQIALKTTGAPANNNSTGESQPQAATKPGTGQIAQAEAPASTDTVKIAHTEIDPAAGGVAQERGKKTDASFDTAIVSQTDKAGVASHSTVQTAEPAKSLDQAERVALVKQVADQLGGSSLKAGSNQVTVRLNPENWGKVEVQLSVTPASQPGGTAQVTAHLTAESSAVKAALDSNLSDLRKALESAGLNLRDAVVSVQAASSAASSGSAGNGNGAGSHHNPGSWDAGGSQTAGSQQGQGGFASFTGGGQGGGNQSRSSYRTSTVDAVETPAPIPAASVKVNGRLDTRA